MLKEKQCAHCLKMFLPKEHGGSESWARRKYCSQACCRKQTRSSIFKRKGISGWRGL